MSSRARRKRCSCGQDLALSSYYRHINDVTGDICPARYKPNLDSTFDFGSSSEEGTNTCDEDDVSEQASDFIQSESDSSDIAMNEAFSNAVGII